MTPSIACDIDGVLVDFVREVFIPTLNTIANTTHEPNYHPQQWELGVELCDKDTRDMVWRSDELLLNMLHATPLKHALTLAKSWGEHVVFVDIPPRGIFGVAEAKDYSIR